MPLPERPSLAPLAAPPPSSARPVRRDRREPWPVPSLRGCGEVIGADSGCGPPRSALADSRARGGGGEGGRGRGPGRGPQRRGSASSARGPPHREARQRPRPGARGPGTAGPNLPAAARPAPAAALRPPIQHGRPRSAGSTAYFRFRLPSAGRDHAHSHGVGSATPPPRPPPRSPCPWQRRSGRRWRAVPRGAAPGRQGAPAGGSGAGGSGAVSR